MERTESSSEIERDRFNTRILYKKPYCTISVSNTGTKSRQSCNSKRDFGLETDYCVIRRYLKRKRNFILHNCEVTTRRPNVKAFDIKTESDDANHAILSACGDTFDAESCYNKKPKLDIECLLIENLRSLLNRYIDDNHVEDKEIRKRVETTFHTLLNSLEYNRTQQTSSTSQNLHNQASDSTSDTPYNCKQCRNTRCIMKEVSNNQLNEIYSCCTIPFKYKKIRIISTLSIPRKLLNQNIISKQGKYVPCQNHKKNGQCKTFLLSINDSDTSLVNIMSVGSMDSKKSFKTKRLYKNKKNVSFYKSKSKCNLKSSRSKHSDLKNLNVIRENTAAYERAPSLVMSIYADEDICLSNSETYEAEKADSCTMTDFIEHKNDAKYNCVENKVEYKSIETKNMCLDCNQNKGKDSRTSKGGNQAVTTKIKNSIKVHTGKRTRKSNPKAKIRHKRCNNLTSIHNQTNVMKKGVMNKLHKFVKTCLKPGLGKNMNLDIVINICPNFDDIKNNEEKIQPKKLSEKDLDPVNKVDIINILDGAVSHDVFLDQVTNPANTIKLKTPTTTNNTIVASPETVSEKQHCDQTIPKNNITEEVEEKIVEEVLAQDDNNTLNNEQQLSDPYKTEIVKEIYELKSVMKSIADTAEKFFQEHNDSKSKRKIKKSCSSKVNRHVTSDDDTTDANSKGVQVSRNFIKAQCLKYLRDENLQEKKYQRMPKNNSYHYIDSESVLKITDMTSAANQVSIGRKSFMSQGITCSLTKTRSLYEISHEKDYNQNDAQKEVTKTGSQEICYDETVNRENVTQPKVHQNPCKIKISKSISGRRVTIAEMANRVHVSKQVNAKMPANKPRVAERGDESNVPCYRGTCSTNRYKFEKRASSAIIDIEQGRPYYKKVMPFWEGLLYCLLLWVPVLISMVLFYFYVIEPKLNLIAKLDVSKNVDNANSYKMLPSDLGFS